MDDYLLGCDILGSDLGKPVLIEDPEWGKPVTIEDEDWGKPMFVAGVDLGLRNMFDVLGMVDFNQAQRQMDELTPVTVSVANSLARGGLMAINGAIAGAKQPWYKADLPGTNSRANVLGKLNWHQANIAKLTDQNALYPNFLDLKQWVLAAYREANAVEEGAAYIDAAWSSMWAEIRVALAAIPAQTRQALVKTADAIVRGATGIPIWGWALIGVGALVLVGGILYAVINSRAGAAVTKHYLGR